MPPAGKNAAGGGSRAQNGNRPGFRTDSAISNSRQGGERVLQRWVPDANDAIDDSLEATTSSGSGGGWDQFAENERLFGLKTDYDENIYTTAINKNHPQYRERIAAAERKAREIERSTAATAHVAEERVMDYVAGQGPEENEEDKYSGVRRQDFPPLGGGQESKYTPPAKRAPSSQATVKGAPVDPAIISSQIKAPAKKPAATDDAQSSKNGAPQQAAAAAKPSEAPANVWATPTAKSSDKVATPASNADASSRNQSPQVKEEAPSATLTVERDVLKSFKTFASQQRDHAQKVRSSKARADKEVKLTELKKFANSFKLSTPVPTDLVSIIAKDPSKQKEIQAKAIRNAEDVAKSKEDGTPPKDKAASTSKDAQAKPAEQQTPTAKNAQDTRVPRGPTSQTGPQGAGGPGNRHQGGHRQQFPQQPYQAYRNNRGGPQHVPGGQQGLAQRIRNGDQQKYGQPSAGPQNAAAQDGRAPPTGPANAAADAGFNRRSSAVPHIGGKLNPNSHEFRPSPFAASFNPGGRPSASSSPRSGVNQVSEASTPAAVAAPLIRRKTKAIDAKKCYILTHIKTFSPPQGRNWDENGGLRPSFDTLPTWRQLQDDEKPDSTMHLTYKEYFDRQPFATSAIVTPTPPHVVPQIAAHHHQLPFHLQPQMGPRQSPHMGHMQMHTPQHSGPQPAYGHDDHRMVHSNSAQSFASPRLGQASMAYPGPGQMPYQPVFMGPGTPQMGQFRSFSNNPQYMSPQQGQMGSPMMMQPHFMPGPQGMVGAPQMMYPGAHGHFVPMGGPPQPGPGVNGYPSPGRPAAPMMAHQGSQQGQAMYGMSPSVQYSQPAYGGPGQPPQPPQPQQQQQPGGPMPPRGYQQHPGKHHGAHRGGANGYGRRGQGHQYQQHHERSARGQSGGGQGHGPAGQSQADNGSDDAK